MNASELQKLLQSCESIADAAERTLSIARALAAGYRSGVHPPDVVLEAYFTTFERDAAQLAHVRDLIEQLKNERALQPAER